MSRKMQTILICQFILGIVYLLTIGVHLNGFAAFGLVAIQIALLAALARTNKEETRLRHKQEMDALKLRQETEE